MSSNDFSYIGNELELFEHARNWKNYYHSYFASFLKSRICEVGAGIGGTTKSLCSGTEDKWICVEPDKEMCNKIKARIINGELPSNCETFCGTLDEYDTINKFGAVLYIDVIEHIELDKNELETADLRISNEGYLIIVVPAFQFLYNKFDKAIGHFRRYNKRRLKAALPDGYNIIELKYLDSVGFFTSVLNKYLLKQEYPTLKQVKFWDSYLVPISKVLDLILFFGIGKSLLLVAQKY
jgi:hypothetical protein